jgi:DNA topoisomerase-1
MFPPAYEPHMQPVIYNGQRILLTAEQEEYATMYAKYYDTEYIKSERFRKNFWKDWSKILGKEHPIKDIDGCNFKLIYDFIVARKEKQKTLSKQQKEKAKIEKEKHTEKYRIAMVDDAPQPVGNFMIEPPGIFLGRGCHPLLGRVKPRVEARDITLNLSKDAPVPELPEGERWGKIVHENSGFWIASWKDYITGKMKYVWLSDKSDYKSQSDLEKFETARRLKDYIDGIRIKNIQNLTSRDMKKRQLATALYFVDNYSLRVGNEKGDDQADTVGVTSLRVEHVENLPDNEIKLDFLGKDSVRFLRTFKVDEQIYKNLLDFKKGKKTDDEIFDKINPKKMNAYLGEFMKGLTAKVFRTFNASFLFQQEIDRLNNTMDGYKDNLCETKNQTNCLDKFDVLLDGYNKANAKVALLCNHQKNISKNFNDQIEKINEQLSALKEKKKTDANPGKIEKQIKKLDAKLEMKEEVKNLSLGTSKINYIDPRITVAFMKKHGIDIGKIFTKTLQEKFKWAFEVDETYHF